MPEDNVSLKDEVVKDDNKTSFLETAINVVKKGVYVVGGMWAAAGIGKVVLDTAYGGNVDTTFLEQAWNSLTPVFTGFVSAFIGFFIGKQS